jgi:DNA modification methylase
MDPAPGGGARDASVDLWREVLRVVKPGAHLLAFGGTRTYHRLVVAIEDAGFEIRDCIAWMYGKTDSADYGWFLFGRDPGTWAVLDVHGVPGTKRDLG